MANPQHSIRKAQLLTAPSLVIAMASICLLPWLFETRRRLDNEYWEQQILFALIALTIAALGVPFVILRLFGRFRLVTPLGWMVVASGYLAMILYFLQSRSPIGSKALFSLLGLLCMRWAVQGWLLDRRP